MCSAMRLRITDIGTTSGGICSPDGTLGWIDVVPRARGRLQPRRRATAIEVAEDVILGHPPGYARYPSICPRSTLCSLAMRRTSGEDF